MLQPILRWLIDSEPDVHFRLRLSLPGLVLVAAAVVFLPPFILMVSSLALLQPATFTLRTVGRFTVVRFLPPPFTVLSTHAHTLLHSLLTSPGAFAWARAPCVLCGCGDNSVQHWLCFCPVPALACSYLLNRRWTTAIWFLHPTSPLAFRALVAAFWVGTRQCVHERSGLPPPSLCPLLVFSSDPLIMVRHLVDRGFSLFPAAYQPTHVRPLSPFIFMLFPGSYCFSYPHPGTRGVCDEIDLEEMILSHFVSAAQR